MSTLFDIWKINEFPEKIMFTKNNINYILIVNDIYDIVLQFDNKEYIFIDVQTASNFIEDSYIN